MPKTEAAPAVATLGVNNINDLERAFLATCQKIYRRHSECAADFQKFFLNLVLSVQHDVWPASNDVAREFWLAFERPGRRARKVASHG